MFELHRLTTTNEPGASLLAGIGLGCNKNLALSSPSVGKHELSLARMPLTHASNGAPSRDDGCGSGQIWCWSRKVKYDISSRYADILPPRIASVGQAKVGSSDETKSVGERPGAKIGTGTERFRTVIVTPSTVCVLSVNV